MDNEIFQTMQDIADKRAAAVKKCSGMTCPECGNPQIELVSYMPKVLLKCRDSKCKHRWTVEV